MADSDSHSGSDAPKRPMVAFQRNRQRPVSVEVAADVDATAVPAASSSLSAPPLHQSHALPGRKATLSKLLQAGGARRVKVKRRPLAPSNSAMQDAAPRPVMPWTGAYAGTLRPTCHCATEKKREREIERALRWGRRDMTDKETEMGAMERGKPREKKEVLYVYACLVRKKSLRREERRFVLERKRKHLRLSRVTHAQPTLVVLLFCLPTTNSVHAAAVQDKVSRRQHRLL